MDKKSRIFRSILSQIYINDERLQDRIIEAFTRFYHTEEVEDEAILASRLAGFVYSYIKSNLCRKDDLAWESFMEMFSALFHNQLISRFNLRDELLREEIIQAFLHHIMKKCEEGRFKPSSQEINGFRGYIMTAFRNFTTNYLQRRMPRIQSIDDIQSMIESGEGPELKWCEKILLIMEIHGFSTEERMIIRLKCDGYRQKEIAEILNRSEAYISRKFRATVERLRQYFSGKA